MVFVHPAVGKYKNIRSVFIGAVALHKQVVKRPFKRGVFIVKQRNGLNLKAGAVYSLNLYKLRRGDNRVGNFKYNAVGRLFFKQISVRADIYARICHNLLADSVDRRGCNLCEKLFKIVKEGLMLFRKHCKRNIRTHSGSSLRAVLRHRNYCVLNILIGIAERLIKSVPRLLVIPLNAAVRHFKLVKPHEILVEPLAVGLSRGVIFLALLVGYNALVCGIHKEHFTGLKAAFLYDMLGGNVENAHLRGQNKHIIVGYIVS